MFGDESLIREMELKEFLLIDTTCYICKNATSEEPCPYAFDKNNVDGKCVCKK